MSPTDLAATGLASLSAALLSYWGAERLLAFIDRNPSWNSLPGGKPLPAPNRIFPAVALLIVLSAAAFDVSGGLLLAFFSAAGWLLFLRVPKWKKEFTSRKKTSEMREVFPQTLGMAIQSLKTGQTFSQALEYLSREGTSPLKEEFSLVCAEINLGSPVDQALAKMGDRYPAFLEWRPFLESFNISRKTGANLIQLLEVLVEGMEEKNRILRKMDSLTAQARLSGLLIGLLPFLMAAVFFVMDPELMKPLFTEKSGWAILFLAALLETIGFVWIRQLLRLEV